MFFKSQIIPRLQKLQYFTKFLTVILQKASHHKSSKYYAYIQEMGDDQNLSYKNDLSYNYMLHDTTINQIIRMKKASPVTFLQLKKKKQVQEKIQQQDIDMNIFVVTFNGMKEAQSQISGGDPYTCVKCKAILNKFSTVLSAKDSLPQQKKVGVELKNNQSLWQCQFCGYPNVIKVDKQQIPTKDDIVYLVQSDLENQSSQNDSTMVFCIDTSGSMNTTSEVEGKVDFKFGISQEEIDMLRQFMEPGDEIQFNYLPGNHNKNKSFVSRKQCILSAIESQLKEIKKSDPNKRVGFVTFNNEVTIIGDNKTATVNIVGDKLNNRQAIVDSLAGFKLAEPLGTSYDTLVNQLSKQQAKGQTALGPALVSAIEVASKGSPGSTVILCTDGLANIGIGLLDPLTEQNEKLYTELAVLAKERNLCINIMSIKGQSSKMSIIGKLAEFTNGNMKVVNPETLSDDFANVLKDEVVGVNVDVTIQLHKAMKFRNEDKDNLFDNSTILKKKLANATVNTKISFDYELKCEEDLKFMEIDVNQIKKVPFQTQILYTSPRGGKFLRVVSSESKTTTDKKESIKNVNIGVAHQRVAAITTNLYSKGTHTQSVRQNQMWSNYLMDNFQEEKYQAKQASFNSKNHRLNQAISNKIKKTEKKEKVIKQEKMQEEQVYSDEDEMDIRENLMEKRSYNMSDDEDKLE